MATWKKVILAGENISELNNDSGFITSTSGALATSGGTLSGNLLANSDESINLGSSSAYWNQAFISHITSKDFINIQIDDAEQYFTNTANNDYWRIRRDASNNFIVDHYNGSSTLTAMSFDSSQNLTLSKQLTIPNKIQHDGDTGTYIGFTDGQIDLKGSGGVRLMISDNEHINFYTGSSSNTALNLSSDQSATFYGHIVLLDASGSGGVLKLGASEDIQIYHDGSNSYLDHLNTGNLNIRSLMHGGDIKFHTEASDGTQYEALKLESTGVSTFAGDVQIGTAGNDTSTSLRVNTGLMIHKNNGTEGNDVSITFDRRYDGAYAYIKATAGDDGAYATNLQFITKGHNGSAYQLYTGLTIDDEGCVLIQGNTRLTSEGSTKRLKLHGSGDNYVLTGCYDDNGWAYFNSYNNANGMQFYISAGIYSFRNGKMMIGVESSGTATSANLFIIGANNAGDGIKISRAGDSQNALDQYAQLNMNQGTTNLISRGGTSSEGTIAFQTTADGSTHNTRMYINASGNIGVNSSAPSKLLTLSADVSGETQQLLIVNKNDSDGDTSGILFGVLDDATYAKAGIFFERTDAQARGSLHFATDNATDSGYAVKANARMTITQAGNVGIGNTSPSKALHVTGEVRFTMGTASVDFDTVGGDGHMAITDSDGATKINLDAEGDNYLNGGNLGIGETSPTARLTLTDTGGDGTEILRIQGSASDTFNWMSSSMSANLASGESNIHLFGQAESTKNSGYIGYKFSSSGSDANLVTIGHYGANHILNISGAGDVGIGREPLGTAYGVGASSILEIGTSATDTAGTIELVGNTNGADTAIGNILWRNEHNHFADGVNYWGGSGEGVARIQVSNVQGSSTAGEQGSEMTFWTKAFGGDCAKRLSISSVGDITVEEDLKVEGDLSVDGAYPFMLTSTFDCLDSSDEQYFPINKVKGSGKAGSSMTTSTVGADLANGYIWVSPFATTLRAFSISALTASGNTDFEIEVATNLAVYTSGSATTVNTYTKNISTSATTFTLSAGLSIAKGNAIRFRVDPATNADEMSVNFVFE